MDGRLLIIKHSGDGTEAEGKALCAQIRAAIGSSSNPLIVFHDATRMSFASMGYALAFKALDAELGPRVDCYVCSIPNAVPRMMAMTVALASSKKWEVFKTSELALGFIAARGCPISAEEVSAAPAVMLR